MRLCVFFLCMVFLIVISSSFLKSWVGVQRSQSYLMGKKCVLSLGWLPFEWWCHDKNTLWGRYFTTSTSLVPHLFLLGWLNQNLNLFLDQLRLAYGDEGWWQLWLVLMLILFWLSQTWPVTLKIQVSGHCATW